MSKKKFANGFCFSSADMVDEKPENHSRKMFTVVFPQYTATNIPYNSVLREVEFTESEIQDIQLMGVGGKPEGFRGGSIKITRLK